MKLLEKLSLVSQTYLSRDYVKLMSIDLVRKDFELIRIGEHLGKLCKEIEFYSKCSDDLLSIEQCYEFASGEVVNNFLDDVFFTKKVGYIERKFQSFALILTFSSP